MAVTTPSVWYANYGNGTNTGYFAVTQWAALTAKTVGQIVRQLAAPTAANERTFICIIAGTTLAAEPTWVTTVGAKTAEAAGPTWMECTGQPGLNGDLTDTPLSSANRSGAQVLGNLIQNNAGTFYFICTTAGTTGAGEPSYTLTAGVTTADNTCTWTCLGAVGGFTSWMAPFSRVGNAGSSAKVPVTGALYVSSAHAETAAANTSVTGLGGGNDFMTQVICVANAGSFPPVAADITTGASITTTGATALSIANLNVEYNGFTFVGGTAASSLNINSTGSGSFVKLRNCALSVPSTAGRITFSNGVEMINTTVLFGNSAASQGFGIVGTFIWRDTPSALAATTAWPTSLFAVGTNSDATVLIEGVDLSAFAGTRLFADIAANQRFVFSHCKLPSATIYAANGPGYHARTVDLINCDTAGATYNTQRFGYDCAQQTSTTAVLTGGASDGTTPFSWVFTAGGNRTLSWPNPFEAMPIVVWNTIITPSNLTITLEGAYVGNALPYNDDFWFDVLYFGTASSTLSTRGTCTKATTLTTHTQWSASSQLWGGSAPARQNSTAYVRGDVIGVSSASSIVRLFVCTTTGTSNGSLPAGYASAVDGGTVTDSGATFTAVERFTMTLTLSAPKPQAVGYIYIYPKIANNGNGTGNYQTLFIDPKPVLS